MLRSIATSTAVPAACASRAADLIERAPAMGTAIPCPHPATSSCSRAVLDPSSTAVPRQDPRVRGAIVQRSVRQVGLSQSPLCGRVAAVWEAARARCGRSSAPSGASGGAGPGGQPRRFGLAHRRRGWSVHHWPQLLGHLPVVGRGPGCPRMAYSPRLMRWMITKSAGTVAYWAMGELRSKVWRTVAEAYSGVHADRGVGSHSLVEMLEVPPDLLRADRRAGAQQPGRLDRRPEPGVVRLQHRVADHRLERGHRLLRRSASRGRSRGRSPDRPAGTGSCRGADRR